MSNPICPNYTRPEINFCPARHFTAPEQHTESNSLSFGVTALMIGTVALGGVILMKGAERQRAENEIRRAAYRLMTDGAISAAEHLAPVAADVASAAFRGVQGFWQRMRGHTPAAEERAIAPEHPAGPTTIEQPALAELITPEIHVLEVLENLERSSLERFKETVSQFIEESDMEQLTPQDYSRFIEDQRITTPEVPLETMHQIFSEILREKKGLLISDLITVLGDHSTIDASIERRKQQALVRKEMLLKKEQELAGSDRFNGLVDGAWREYFKALINQTESLSKLCHYLKSEGMNLTLHEDAMLHHILHPHYEHGRSEIAQMQNGLMTMIGASSFQTTLALGRRHQNTEELCQSLQSACRRVSTTFERYSTLHAEREEIAGEGIDPTRVEATEDSLLGQTEAQGSILDTERAQEIAKRQSSIAWLESLLAGRQNQFVSL